MPVNQDYVDPASFSQRRLLGTLWAGVTVSLFFLLFRFYVRVKIFRRLHIEDPFVLAAWLMNLVNAVIWQKTANKLYSVIAVESGQISMPPPEYDSNVYSQFHGLFASYLLYYTALWCVKLSYLLFFRNLGNSIRRQRILWYWVFAFTMASYVSCLCMIDYRCLVEPRGLARCETAHDVHYILYLRLATVFDTTTDGLIILMSTNFLWNASIEVRKKLALTGIFSLTILIISVSITRVVLTTRGPRLDLTWLLLWSGLEMSVAIIVACLASFRILYTSSERSRRSTLVDEQPNRATRRLGDDHGIPLSTLVLNSSSVIAVESTGHRRESSADTFEEAILPMDNVYVQHKYSVFPETRKNCEEIRSPLESPVVRTHYHGFPSYRYQDTVWEELGRPQS